MRSRGDEEDGETMEALAEEENDREAGVFETRAGVN